MSANTSHATRSNPGTTALRDVARTTSRTVTPGYVKQTDAQKISADRLFQRPSATHAVTNDNAQLPMAERIRADGI